jgi:hypothetical protein
MGELQVSRNVIIALMHFPREYPMEVFQCTGQWPFTYHADDYHEILDSVM